MKHSTLLLITFFLILNANLFSQRANKIIKVGCIDIQKIIDKVSDDQALKNILKNDKNQFLKQAKKLSEDIKKLKSILDYENRLSSARINEIRKEIEKKEKELDKYLSKKSDSLRYRDKILSQEILANIYKIIKKVAVREGYSLILEKSAAVVYVDDKVDITKEVIRALEKEKGNW